MSALQMTLSAEFYKSNSFLQFGNEKLNTHVADKLLIKNVQV